LSFPHDSIWIYVWPALAFFGGNVVIYVDRVRRLRAKRREGNATFNAWESLQDAHEYLQTVGLNHAIGKNTATCTLCRAAGELTRGETPWGQQPPTCARAAEP
jgi:hypothetical protein